jgi:aspartate racemase
MQLQGDWEAAGELLASAAQRVEGAGADCLLIATNTMHKVAPAVERAITIPLLHIADATAEQLQADGIRRVGLLGTRFTMEQDFYIGRLEERFGIEVVVPHQAERDIVHRVIFEELCQGRVDDVSRQRYLTIIDSLYAQGAQAVILGCTEIAMLVSQQDTPVPLYDTTALHAQKAVAWALSD